MMTLASVISPVVPIWWPSIFISFMIGGCPSDCKDCEFLVGLGEGAGEEEHKDCDAHVVAGASLGFSFSANA